MDITTRGIREGQHNGKDLWVCHYNKPDLTKKPLRCLPPTRVKVKGISELPKGKVVYYSQSYFQPYNAKGKLLSKIISPVDNTGFRSRAGNEVHVFEDKVSCVAKWNEQVQEVLAQYSWKMERVVNSLRVERDLLAEKLIKRGAEDEV